MGVLPLTSSCDQLVARLSLRSSGAAALPWFGLKYCVIHSLR